jgi:1-phosphofructokinase
MIVTVTPNPSVDRTLEIDRLRRGLVLRATGGRVDPGGKGVNVSRALAEHGISTTAVLPLGGAEGRRMVDLLTGCGVALRVVEIHGTTRANITVVEPDGTTTKINESGPAMTGREIDALLTAVLSFAGAGRWVVGSGSVPVGVDDDFHARLVTALAGHGGRTAVDTSGAALDLAVRAGPDLVKPNRAELAEVTGIEIRTLGEVLRAAGELRGRGARAVLVSLGVDGAVLLDDDGVVYGTARVRTTRSSVGAGDAMLAGFLSASRNRHEAFRAGLAWGAAAVTLPGSRMPAPGDVAAVTVGLHDPDPAIPLRDVSR